MDLKLVKNSKGFSLLEVVIALGIAGVGLLVFMQANQIGVKGQKQAEITVEVESLRMEVIKILADPNSCLYSFSQKPLNPFKGLYKVSRGLTVLPRGAITPGLTINGVTVEGMKVDEIRPVDGSKKQFQLEMEMRYKVMSTERTRKFQFPFYAYTDAEGNITGCFSSSWNELGDQNDSIMSDFCIGLLGGKYTDGSCLFEVLEDSSNGVRGIQNSSGKSLLPITELFKLLEERIDATSQYLTENNSLITKNTLEIEDKIIPSIAANEGLARGQEKRLARFALQHGIPLDDLKENPEWSAEWYDVSVCKSTFSNPVLQCSAGKIIRTRKCLFQDSQKGALTCPGNGSSVDSCPLPICSVAMPTGSAWVQIKFGADNSRTCSEQCGGGVKIKYRYCFSDIHEQNGLNYQCTNEAGSVFARGEMEVVEETCNTQQCDDGVKPKVDGKWSDWMPTEEGGACAPKYSLTQRYCVAGLCHEAGRVCGTGTSGKISEYRTCTNPPPSGGGATCGDDNYQDRDCTLPSVAPNCPGKTTNWVDSNPCSATCGPGTKTQKRDCVKSELVRDLENKIRTESGDVVTLTFSCSENLTRQVSCNLGACP